MNTTPLRAILWIAVSTSVQAQDDRMSLPQQEADARAKAEAEGWQVIDVLRVPGHSRRYVDIHEVARDMRSNGIDAFDMLLKHWTAKDFDVLVCRDGSRFARTQALHAYVVERTINDTGARIYSLNDGWIDRSNFRMWISMGGYSAAGEIDRLVNGRRIAMDNNVAKGIPTNSRVVMSHRVVRNDKNKAVGIELNPEYQRLWLNLAELLLEGIPLREIEQELFDRFGHANQLGEPYHRGKFNKILNTPSFWGHSCRYHRGKGGTGKHRYITGPWQFEPGHPIPDGIIFAYNTHEPVYKGDLARRVISELIRRQEEIGGRASPRETYRFSGIFVCAECGYNLSKTRTGNWTGLRCKSRNEQSATRPACANTKYLSEKSAQAYIDQRLREMVAIGNPDVFIAPSDAQDAFRRIDDVQREINEIDARLRRLILDKASAPEDVTSIYDQEITKHGSRLKNLKDYLRAVQREAAAADNSQRQIAFEELRNMSVDTLWKQNDRVIHQFLVRLMGKKRFAVQGGEIVGVADAPIRRRRY
jgi:hypothetical protein